MLAHSKTGSGQTIVFLHGFCEWRGYWVPAVEALSHTFECISLDLPGHGDSAVIPELSLEDMAYEVVSTLTKISVYEFVLVGHSMGGYVALAIAGQFPEKIKGLCLINSTALDDSEEKKQQRNKTIEYLKEHGVDEFIEPFVPPLFHPKNRDKCSAAIRSIIDNGLKMSLEGIAAATVAMRNRPDRTEVLKELGVPVLFIIGKNDTAVKLEDILPQIELPAQSFVQFTEPCGHQSLYEDMPQTLKMIEMFAGICYGK